MIEGELAVHVRASDTIDTTIRRMAQHAPRVRHVGIAVVLEEGGRVVGVVTDGDIRRAYAADIPFSEPVARIMSADPIRVPADIPVEDVPAEVFRRIRREGRLKADIVRHVLVTNAEGHLVGIYDSLILFAHADKPQHRVAIFGAKRIGLGLAVVLARHGHSVDVVGPEPRGLASDQDEALRTGVEAGRITFVAEKDLGKENSVHIVAIEPRIDAGGDANLEPVNTAASSLGQRLHTGDVVMLCSSVPIGTTRGSFRDAIERTSGLRAGVDFALAFASASPEPGSGDFENTLRIVGGVTQHCASRAAAFWKILTPFVMALPTLEASELAALAAPAFRHVNASFSHDLLEIADRHNIAINDVIDVANRSLPRAEIPALASEPADLTAAIAARLLGGGLARRGETAAEGVAAYPARIVKRFAERRRTRVDQLKVLVLGDGERVGAANGEASPAASTVAALLKLGADVSVWPALDTSAGGAHPHHVATDDIPAAIASADAIILNSDHQSAIPWGFAVGLSRQKLIFDGASVLDRAKIESIAGVVYATPGYMTAPRCAVIACDNGFGHVRRCAAITTALRERGTRCDLFVPPEVMSRVDGPTIAFQTRSTPEGWRTGAPDTIGWQDRLPNLDRYDYVIADSLPEILARRPDAILIGHFLWTQALPDVVRTHVERVEALLAQMRPRMIGTGMLASDRLKAATQYRDAGFFARNEIDLCPTERTELLVSSGLGAEPGAVEALRDVVAALSVLDEPPHPLTHVHVEPALLAPKVPRWMIPASYEPGMYRRLAAAIIRPGAGTITDCVSRAVWMIWLKAPENEEIEHNARALQSQGLGTIASSAADAIDLAVQHASNRGSMAEVRERCGRLPFDGARVTADVILGASR